jgi:hypothetical protein
MGSSDDQSRSVTSEGIGEAAAYVKKFDIEQTTWRELLEENIDRIRRGAFSLHWLETKGSGWGTKVKPSSRGLLMTDINRPQILR